MGALPDQISNERQAAFSDISKLISDERTAVLKAFDDRASKLRVIMSDSQTTIDRADVLLSSLHQTMASAEKRVAHVFWRLVILFAFIGVIGAVIVFVHHRMIRKDEAV